MKMKKKGTEDPSEIGEKKKDEAAMEEDGRRCEKRNRDSKVSIQWVTKDECYISLR